MNKWLMLAVLVLMVLVSAFGLRNFAATHMAATPTISASTGNPVPVMDNGKGKNQLLASTGNPVPVMDDGKGQLF